MFRRPPKTAVIAAAAGLGGGAMAASASADDAVPDSHAEPAVVLAGEALGKQTAREWMRRHKRAAQRALERRKQHSGYTILRVRDRERVALRAKPGGRVVAFEHSHTDFGSPQTLTVVERRGRWLGVTSTELPNNRLGWVNGRTHKLQRRRTKVSLSVDVSGRTIEFRDGRVQRRVRVSLGAAASPTPVGRFAITDKLSGSPYGGVYGCCVLAMSGHQTHPPSAWTGGDRLAIHGTPGGSGRFTGSAGCVRADARTLKMLMRNVPLGTPVFVRR
jgi:lipoprotein-anchoring transpeptidase ErfK/SrfK